MATWRDVHVGDDVSGADGRVWTVVERGPAVRWLAEDVEVAPFRLRLKAAAATQVETRQRLSDVIHIAHVSERKAEAGAWEALTSGGFTLTAISETTPPTTDPFGGPAEPAGLKRREAPTGRYGWYKLPHPTQPGATVEYPRVTTISNTLADRYGLEAWKMRKVAKGMSLRPDLIAKAAALDVDKDKRAFAEIIESAMEAAESGAAANYGTAVDKFCERVDCGESIESMRVPAEVEPVVRAYIETLKRARLTVLPEYCQRTVVHHGRQYAGTLDRIVRAADGTLYVLDLKTGADVLEYGGLEFGPQQAMYARAEAMCTLDYSGYEPMPAVDRDKALILHVPFVNPSAAKVYAIDISDAAAGRAVDMSLHVREIRKQSKKWIWVYSPGTPADAVQLRIGRAANLDELMAAVADAKRIGEWNAEIEALALARYDVIRAATAESRQALAALWSELEPVGRWTDAVSEAANARAAELAERR